MRNPPVAFVAVALLYYVVLLYSGLMATTYLMYPHNRLQIFKISLHFPIRLLPRSSKRRLKAFNLSRLWKIIINKKLRKNSINRVWKIEKRDMFAENL